MFPLSNYQTLISLEPKVSESAHVVGYFSPRIGDKQLPKYVVIMTSL